MKYTANDMLMVKLSSLFGQPSLKLWKLDANVWSTVVPSAVTAVVMSQVTSFTVMLAFARNAYVTNTSIQDKSRKKNSILVACQIRDLSSSPSVS